MSFKTREERFTMEAAFNTYMFDVERAVEMTRLVNQDRMMTQAMGGPLAGIPDPAILQDVLDLGCGPGGWVLDVAIAAPFARVEGVDISRLVVDYAKARARMQKLTNTSFSVMDITGPLDFPDAAFDVVNARFLALVLKQEDWSPFLNECTRVLRPGGILRLTEVVNGGVASSASLNQLMALFIQAIWRAGYGFSPDGTSVGVITVLPALLRERSYRKVCLQPHLLEYSCSVNMETWAEQFHNIDVAGIQMKSHLMKYKLIPSDKAFDQLYAQALTEMQHPQFFGYLNFTTVLGQKRYLERIS